MQSYARILFLLILASSCDEPTELDLRQTPAKVVIEGLLTNQPGYQAVKVSTSARFYASGQTPRIEDALVKVTDDHGYEFPFVHNPSNHPDSAGIYIPLQPFHGVIGRTYTLSVEANGAHYEGSDKLMSVIPIDSLAYRINKNQQEDPNEPGKIYELLLYAREPQNEENFYLFKYYRNDSLIFYNPIDIYFSDDILLAEKIDGVPSPVYYGANDTARMELYSLTRKGFIFYTDLTTVLNNDGGGMFGSIPAPPRSNLTNGALGFFQVSAVQDKQAHIR